MALTAYKTHPSRKYQILADVDERGNITPAGRRPNPDYNPKAKSNLSNLADDPDYEYVDNGTFIFWLIVVLVILGGLVCLVAPTNG